jgi:hypothetical protein
VLSTFIHLPTPYRVRISKEEQPTNASFNYSRFRRKIYEVCSLLGYYEACRGNSLPTFRDNLSALKCDRLSSWISWPLNTGPTGCTETSARNYHYTLCNIPEELTFRFFQCLCPYVQAATKFREGVLTAFVCGPVSVRDKGLMLQLILQT